MSRKHYIATASIIRAEVDKAESAKDTTSVLSLTEVAKGMAVVFAKDNPAFSRQRFLDACGI